jgi:hypothetical protein
MALQKAITTDTGFTATQAYGRVVELKYYRNKTDAILSWYKDAASAGTVTPIQKDKVTFAGDVNLDDNLVGQAYAAFKAKEELSDAIDV